MEHIYLNDYLYGFIIDLFSDLMSNIGNPHVFASFISYEKS